MPEQKSCTSCLGAALHISVAEKFNLDFFGFRIFYRLPSEKTAILRRGVFHYFSFSFVCQVVLMRISHPGFNVSFNNDWPSREWPASSGIGIACVRSHAENVSCFVQATTKFQTK